MPEHQPTEAQPASRPNPGPWLLILGGVVLFFGLYISAFLIPDVIQTAGGPQPLTLDEAAQVASAERTYARIEDGAWDCDTLTLVRGWSPSQTKYTEIFFTDAAREVVVLVTLSGEVACDQLSGEAPSGYLYAMGDDTRQALTNEARLARFFMADEFLEFCGYCGRDNSLLGAIFGVVFTLIGAAMLIGGWRLRQSTRAA